MSLWAAASTLVVLHFSIPIAYYFYTSQQAKRPWNIALDPTYRPNVTVIVPTWNESALIRDRLTNIREQSYPPEKTKLMVVDSGSTDNTVGAAEDWNTHNSTTMPSFQIIKEPVRRGKIFAMNYALEHVDAITDIVVFTDADCKWNRDALTNSVKYFADPIVAAVTCSIYPLGKDGTLESTYRQYNNSIRIGESKIETTPIFHGPFAAFRYTSLKQIEGVPTWAWADDSGPAALLGLMGYRCIAAPDIVTYELVPNVLRTNISRRARRARHLIHMFTELDRIAKKQSLKPNRATKWIYFIEKILHLVNPWILVSAAIMILIDSTFTPSLIDALLLGVALIACLSRRFRIWVLTQTILAYALIKNIAGNELFLWEPVREFRQDRPAVSTV